MLEICANYTALDPKKLQKRVNHSAIYVATVKNAKKFLPNKKFVNIISSLEQRNFSSIDDLKILRYALKLSLVRFVQW